MKPVRTVKGRVIDMGALIKANETSRAIGNVPMNARGDRLDASGNVVATVQRIARTQAELAQPSEKRKLSDVPGNKKAAPKKKSKAAASIEPDLMIMSEVIKTREDGTQYTEIEYDDGSIEVKEIK